MKSNQLNLGKTKRVMYIENKEGLIMGVDARIGWVSFSKTGKTIYYKEKVFLKNRIAGNSGNYIDAETGEQYWISGVKKTGSNSHRYEPITAVKVDEDAYEEYKKIRGGASE